MPNAQCPMPNAAIGNRLILPFLVFICFQCACDRQLSEPRRNEAEHRQSLGSNVKTINVGVLFSGEPSYMCIPMDQLGFDDAAAPIDLLSSCECVKPSIVTFVDRTGSSKWAVRIDFLADRANERLEPNLLGVEVSVRSKETAWKKIVLEFLQTYPGGNSL